MNTGGKGSTVFASKTGHLGYVDLMGGSMKRMCYRSCLAVLVVAFAMNAQAQTLDEAAPPTIKEDDRPAPVDYGFGPGVRPEKNRQAVQEMMMAAPGAAPVGSADAQTKGVFGAPVTWPLIGLHVVLLPDGRVMSYGTGEQGQQGGQFVYDVWDPTLGTDTAAHMVLPNTTGTDIFCSGQSVLSSGEVLITGGDLTINGTTQLLQPANDGLPSSDEYDYGRRTDAVSAVVSYRRFAPQRR